jgi:hypothetical protein
MRPIADLSHSAYDTLEFVKQHYPEMVQMYETIMAHLKVPEGNSVITDAFEPEPYMIKGKFNSVILDPDIITALGYTMDECNIIAKRAGLIYLGMYNRTYEKSVYVDGFYSGLEEVTVQAPQFAIVNPRYTTDKSYHGDVLFSIPKAHSLDRIIFSTATECSVTYEGEGSNTIYDFVIKNSGDDWRTDYNTHENEYLCHRHIEHTASELQFNILIGLGDNIKLPEVM